MKTTILIYKNIILNYKNKKEICTTENIKVNQKMKYIKIKKNKIIEILWRENKIMKMIKQYLKILDSNKNTII